MLNLKKIDQGHIIWVISNQGILRILVALKFLVIARFFGPQAMGEFALILLIIAFAESVTEFGFNYSIVSKKERVTSQQLDLVWTISILRGIVICILIIVTSYFYLDFSNQLDIFSSCLIISMVPIIKSMINPENFIAYRNKIFKKIFLWNLIATVFDIVLSTATVYYTKSLFYLAVIMLVSELIRCLSSFYFFKGKRRLSFKFHYIADELNYGKWIWKSSIVTYLVNQLDKFVIPILMGNSAFGGYQATNKLAQFGLSDFSQFVNMYFFPHIAEKKRQSNKQLRSYVKKIYMICSILVIPSAIILIIFSGQIITLTIGDQYLKYRTVYIIHVLSMTFGVYMAINVTISRAIGVPEIITKICYIQLAILATLLFLVYIFKGSILTIASSFFISLFVSVFYIVFLLSKKLKKG
ncbi:MULTISPECIES: oligosaccharide flippase family protein [unclassified Exiguobacterium]|uniref:oligosaccharide flippase family protein n=1 Tax=unclassified Exiguobacterium TaxID=2644629 RepID=UPI0025C34DF3|nr:MULTISPECIES: oligosaccharide flippase family protein [unclassified Exiguobacterium]